MTCYISRESWTARKNAVRGTYFHWQKRRGQQTKMLRFKITPSLNAKHPCISFAMIPVSILGTVSALPVDSIDNHLACLGQTSPPFLLYSYYSAWSVVFCLEAFPQGRKIRMKLDRKRPMVIWLIQILTYINVLKRNKGLKWFCCGEVGESVALIANALIS